VTSVGEKANTIQLPLLVFFSPSINGHDLLQRETAGKFYNRETWSCFSPPTLKFSIQIVSRHLLIVVTNARPTSCQLSLPLLPDTSLVGRRRILHRAYLNQHQVFFSKQLQNQHSLYTKY